MFAVTANALSGYSTTLHVNTDDRFNGTKEWEHTRHYISGGEYIGRLVYGYDTDYVDEDYAWAYGATCYSQAIVESGGQGHYADSAEANHYSKVQVTHEEDNDDVYYYFKLSVNYSNVTAYLDTSTYENRS